MRHTPSFTAFLNDVVNLPQHRIDELETNVDAIFAALDNDDTLGPYVIDKIPQGSWPHRTIIRPVDDGEFDADFLLLLDEEPDWSADPRQYLEQLEAAFRRHGTYSDMVDDDMKSRCVRVIYANEHHVDIVPYLVLSNGRKVIVNRDINDWEDTDPEGFTAWMREKDAVANKNLRKVIRLVKYLRDYQDTFVDVPSVILTALLGEAIDASKKIEFGYYSDVPTTLRNIIADLNDHLQENLEKPSIEDPSGAADPDGNPVTFDHRWSQATYARFRDNIKRYAADIDDAYHETNEDKSLELWQDIFGDAFAEPQSKPKTSSKLGAATTSAAASTATGRGG